MKHKNNVLTNLEPNEGLRHENLELIRIKNQKIIKKDPSQYVYVDTHNIKDD